MITYEPLWKTLNSKDLSTENLRQALLGQLQSESKSLAESEQALLSLSMDFQDQLFALRRAASEEAEPSPWARQILLTEEKLRPSLEKSGLQPIGAVGEPFSYQLHESVQVTDTDDPALGMHVLWDDPRNLSEYWAYLVASICCDADEKANDSKLRRFSQLDIQLCMLRERDRILSEMDIIRKDYPFVYDRHREFLDQLQSDDPEKMKKKPEWEFNIQSGSYAGSFYRELLGIPEKHETVRPAFPDFPDLPFAPDEDNGSAPLFPEPDAPFVREKQIISRNDPCPCGSGKKFKNC